MYKTAYLFLLLFSIVLVKVSAQDANTLLSDMDQIMFGPEDREGTIKITLVNKSGKEKVREATMLQKGTDKKLFRYTLPESQAGIATLSLPGDIMWLYMPALGKPKKISMLAKSQAFTGTDFSYEDMATTTYSSRYVPKLLSTSDEGFELQLTPINEKSHYSKIVVLLEKEYHYPIRMDYYNRGGKKFKEATYTYRKTGKYWNAAKVIMSDLKKKHKTIIQLTNVKFDQGLSDDLFKVENLKPANSN